MRAGLVALLCVIAGSALAEPPKISIFPRLKPVVAVVQSATLSSPRPMPRPKDAVKNAAKTKVAAPKQSLKGAVCGDPDIRGEVMPPIGSKTKGCGVIAPVKVTSIAGVGFSQPATIDCTTAKALKKWMIKGMQPAFGNRQVVKLHIYGSYACRPRNNQRGAKISEHGRGKAVDIAGFIFADGKEWTVRRDYNKTIRRAQKAACGPFGTTLGPGSDGYHEDHLHFDTARYRGGSYCK